MIEASGHWQNIIDSYHQNLKGLGQVSSLPTLYSSMFKAREFFSHSQVDVLKDESWQEVKEGFLKANYRPWPLSRILSGDEVKAITGNLQAHIVLVNGQFVQSLFKASPGIELNRPAPADLCPPLQVDDDYEALNLSMPNDVLDIVVKGQSDLKSPLVIVHIQSEDTNESLVQTRLQIHLEKGANLSVVEIFATLADTPPTNFTNFVTSIELEENSHLNYAQHQKQEQGNLSRQLLKVVQKKNSQSQLFFLNQGSSTLKSDVQVVLEEENANSDLIALAMLEGEQKMAHQFDVHHKAAHTNSQQLYKSLAGDESVNSFYGTVHVDANSQQVDASQLCKSLILSPKAKTHAWPRIRASADDIKCGHGAAIGQLNPEELFYLEARGIDASKARAMLMKGYVSDALERINNPQAKTYFQRAIHV